MCHLMESSDAITYSWTCNPSDIHPVRRVFAWGCVILFGSSIIMSNAILGVALTAVLIASIATFLFKSTFTIDQSGITASYPLRKKFYEWSQIRRLKMFQHSAYMFKRKKPSNLDGWTGLALFFNSNREEIVKHLDRFLSEDVAR